MSHANFWLAALPVHGVLSIVPVGDIFLASRDVLFLNTNVVMPFCAPGRAWLCRKDPA
jgi:hypothetical protein